MSLSSILGSGSTKESTESAEMTTGITTDMKWSSRMDSRMKTISTFRLNKVLAFILAEGYKLWQTPEEG